MSNAPDYATLRALSLEELVKRHDAMATSTIVGVDYYLEEIHRRDAEWQARESAKLARNAIRIAVVSAVISGASIVVTVVMELLRS